MRWAQSSLHFLPLLLLLPSLVNTQGLGDPCTASADGSSTGASSDCTSGFCRYQTCSDPNGSDVGQPCTADNQCRGRETANEQPPNCGGRPGDTTLTCGGVTTFCYALDSSGSGPSPTCASGICRDYQCTALVPAGPGEACSGNYDCAGDDYCRGNICTDSGNACTADDGTASGVAGSCDSGYCRYGGCTDFPTRNPGETCTSDSVCIGETAYDYPAFCGNLPGQPSICGGPSVSCYSLEGGSTGPSPTCASGECKENRCTPLTPTPPGGACEESFTCSGDSTCQSGICTDAGSGCLATDGSSTGTTDTCDSGFCRSGSCAVFPTRNVGDTCTTDSVCLGETAYDTPSFCGNLPNEEPICGGPSTLCYAQDGAGSGASPTCASGQCKNNRCTPFTPTPAGGTCQEDFTCAGNSLCRDGICTDYGTSCTADDDGSLTGAIDTCDSGFCRYGGCAQIPPRNVGNTCSSNEVCVGAETAYDTPPFCGNLPGQATLICGGPSTTCYEIGGGGSGSSPTCASGTCKSYQCTRLDPLGFGEPCRGDYECSGGIFCVSGTCTGGESSCSADDGNSRAIGESDDCGSNFCRGGQCSNVPVALLGDVCDEDRDCSGSDDNLNLLYCGQPRANVRKCGSVGAYCVAADGSGTGAAPELCISGQCENYACNDAAPSPGLAGRANIPTQQVIKARLCPKGFEPCPLYPKGYECIDVLNDIESCGGCVGRGMPGTDCSADVHAREISCVQGKCIISCEPGYFLASNNNTCVAE